MLIKIKTKSQLDVIKHLQVEVFNEAKPEAYFCASGLIYFKEVFFMITKTQSKRRWISMILVPKDIIYLLNGLKISRVRL